MLAKTLMVQGTASSVGKSVLVTALCRILRQDGFRVAPFKSQNMSNNSFVTREGSEMGRAQVVQAQAAGIEPQVDMNPVLLKPEADAQSQVVVLGRPRLRVPAREYYCHWDELLKVVAEALARLRRSYDVVVIEGAGSPAEINLRATEIVNMRIAKLAQAPVILVGDIDRGGVFASIVGTLALLEPEEQELIKGFVVNKFRGDLALLQPGLEELMARTSKPVLGVLPYFRDVVIPQEDSLFEQPQLSNNASEIDIAVIGFPRIANATDFEPLQHEPGARVRYVSTRSELGQPDAVILPGTKSTIADLEFLRKTGLSEEVLLVAASGRPVLGICGGFQMLGRLIKDPEGVESNRQVVAGLGLLDVETYFVAEKRTAQVTAYCVQETALFPGLAGSRLEAYEIHMGHTSLGAASSPFRIEKKGGRPGDHLDGALNPEGNVMGTYLHGLFDNPAARQAFLAALRGRKGLASNQESSLSGLEVHFDRLAALVREHIDIPAIYRLAGLELSGGS